MGILTLAIGLLLPWLGGFLWLALLESRLSPTIRVSRLRQAGYGFFLGYSLLCLAVLTCDNWLGRVSWPWIIAFFTLLAAGAVVTFRSWVPGKPSSAPSRQPVSRRLKILTLILASWGLLHLLLVSLEILGQPLYPWDAWLAWVYRSKAWFLAGGMVEVASPSTWLLSTSPDVYTIDAWSYPRFASIVPYWAALSLGHWSETLINLPVPLAGIAITMALYGQCRETGMSTLVSVTACYLLVSVPLFATHMALAGYADIWMAGFTGLGFVALITGAVLGRRSQAVLGFLMLGLGVLVKNEGVVWLLAALLMQLLITLNWRASLAGVIVLLAGGWTAYALGVTQLNIPYLGKFGVADGRLVIPFIGSFVLEAHNVWPAYVENFFRMSSWNLLWVLVTASLLIATASGRLSTVPAYRVGCSFIWVFAATQVFIFGFTDQGAWADTYTAINRLPLHFLPALIFTGLLIFATRIQQRDLPSNGMQTANA